MIGERIIDNYLKKEGIVIDDRKDIPMINSSFFGNKKIYLKSVLPLRFYFWLSIFRKNNFDVYLVSNRSNEFFLINDNWKKWNEEIRNLKDIDLFCVKKEQLKSVLFFSHASKKGGSEKSLIDLIRGLIKRGILCSVLIPSRGEIENDLENLPVSYGIIHYPWWAKNNVYKKEKKDNLKEIKRSLRSLRKYVSLCNPHVVYTNTSVINVGALVAKQLGKPHIWHIREFGSNKHGIEFYRSFKEIAKFIYDYSDRVLFNSKAVKGNYAKYLPEEKLEVVYNHVDQYLLKEKTDTAVECKYFSKPNSLKLIMVGAVSKGKNQLDAIMAVEKIVDAGIVDVELLIVGGTDPDYHKILVNRISSKKLDEFVHFTGQVKDIFPILNEADLFLICSHDEAFGRVTAEAMLMKKPVIGLKSGGTPELIRDGYNGFLYEEDNTEMLKEKILFFLENKDCLHEYGLNGYNFAQNEFTEEGYSGKINKILEDVKRRNFKQGVFIFEDRKYLRASIRRMNRNDYLKKMLIRLEEGISLSRKAIFVLRSRGLMTFGEYLFRYVRYGKSYFK